jgi:bacteriophage N4 adsorption protein B
MFQVPGWLEGFDRTVLLCLAPLAVAILLSGLDDLVIDLAWLAAWLDRKLRPVAPMFPPGPRQLDSAPIQRIAILVPLWKEHEVIGQMLDHNLAAIRYTDYHFFAGAYPNDHPTGDAVRSVAGRFPNVHLALCPHDGPTSKADCLNWIYQHLSLYEEQNGTRFDVVVIHDAEDLIHPEELRWINFYSTRYDFVQTPVLAMATPFGSFTHGIYCDEFVEYHTRDMPMRPLLGGFVPSSGVGTGYRREALAKLAGAAGNRIFEPEALTEDYENGLRLFRLGCSQAFTPLVRSNGSDFVATRELFPRDWANALRQRTRWVMGIALQGWQRHGWKGRPGEVYWLWRDRKGLIGNPLSLVSNAVFLYGLATQVWMRATPLAASLASITLGILALRTGVRMACVSRVYGIRFALGVPLRAIYANALNSAATFQALARYSVARLQGHPLKWLKTDHVYPSRAALLSHKRKLGEILVGSGRLAAAALNQALATQPAGTRLGEHLVRIGLLDDAATYEALAFQQGLPLGHVDTSDVPRRVARALPEQVARQWQVLPFRIAEGSLFLAGPEPPSPEMSAALGSFTALEIRFHLVTPAEFEKLFTALLS